MKLQTEIHDSATGEPEWVDVEYATAWGELQEAGWSFVRPTNEPNQAVMTKNGYINVFREILTDEVAGQ